MSLKVLSIEEFREIKKEFASAIGFFDGVHLGHQLVINNAISYARRNHIKSLVITFDKSPKIVLGSAENVGYLTPIDEKLRILKEMGVDYALILKFDERFLSLSSSEFISKYLLKIRTRYVSVGFDFKFGHGGNGDSNSLLCNGGFKVEISEPVLMYENKVSTTQIKKCLMLGDLKSVNQMLGRNLSVSGKVVRGKQLGRTIGFPTANIKLDEDYLFALRGAYATISYIDGVSFMSMTNIGFNPTTNLYESISIETHIFDFDSDIYGKRLRTEFLAKIRDEVKFDSLDELVAQLEQDKKTITLIPIGD